MKNLWDNLDNITEILRNHKITILIFDFDGTLTPIVKIPKEANLPPKTRHLLQLLSSKEGCYAAIISGRNLKDLKSKIGLKNIIYGGNHGLEGEIYGQKFSYPATKKVSNAILQIKKNLSKVAAQFHGVFIEDKGLTLSLHFRMAEKQQIPLLKSLFDKTVQPYIENKSVSTVAGKEVLDILPKVNWNKGFFSALVIKKITALTKTPAVAIVIGDDTTDENTFQSLKNEITIAVGSNSQSRAKYYLTSTTEVIRFLGWLNGKMQ